MELYPIGNNVNLLRMQDITQASFNDIDAWFYAIDMLPRERIVAREQIMKDGYFSVCNIEHRVQIECLTQIK